MYQSAIVFPAVVLAVVVVAIGYVQLIIVHVQQVSAVVAVGVACAAIVANVSLVSCMQQSAGNSLMCVEDV